ncbi:hypothetical protein OHA84_36340 [Streptomyces sp. NBC_00513]|uniref:hypothetical protein n=1 Tax=unclassified Streptomyces TaxID=2593676 RepID=UPI002257E55B|nr:hypothetical protein [Streptomyces sp. NBC_00424]MCX5071026.1 hypothetical protein [Streptomyces sp. NBC_00424]WUD45540.1 hypothetical protein OHA84_36340 [Streptomyces sp. NBC_00513]
MNHDVASLALALAAAGRAFAPDVRALMRRLLGAGVRVGAASLVEQRDLSRPEALDEGSR